MTRRLLPLLLFTVAASAGGDPWNKVKDLQSGTEIRVFQNGRAAPLIARFGDITGESLIVIVKKEERAIPLTSIDRIDSRKQKTKMTRETKVESGISEADRAKPNPPTGLPANNTSWSSGINWNTQEFETAYRRPPPATKK